jgi:peroxiredoxin
MTVLFYFSYVLLWILVVFLSVVLLGVLRTVYRTQTAGQAPPSESDEDLIGETLPSFTALDLSGTRIESEALRGQRTALLFISPDCSTCAVTLDELEALRAKVGGKVILFCRGSRNLCARLAERYELSVPVVVDDELSVSDLLRVTVAPTAVLVGASGVILTYGHPMRGAELEELILRTHGVGAEEAA